MAARRASHALAQASTASKNGALAAMATKLSERRGAIREANDADLAAARERGLDEKLVARLGFGDAKIDSRIGSLETIAGLPDPVGQTIAAERRPGGLEVTRVRVPLGVLLMIYEARPHVTVNAGAFCLKSGNAAILRGGSEARCCNALLGELWCEALSESGIDTDAVQVVSGSHEEVGELLQYDDLIDVVMPRGGPGLIRSVASQSRVPVIKHYQGICHVYLDAACDLDTGMDIALDGKCLMPEVCNATETLLVHEAHLPRMGHIVGLWRANGVAVRGCPRVCGAVRGVEAATDADWATEYLDTMISIRVVRGVEEAIAHINTFGSHHTDSIVTDSVASAGRFRQAVDSGVVLVNASTMFCDGASLGMGAEIGISTDRLHARGPMGLTELTTYKFVISGAGTIMGPSRLRAGGGDA